MLLRVLAKSIVLVRSYNPRHHQDPLGPEGGYSQPLTKTQAIYSRSDDYKLVLRDCGCPVARLPGWFRSASWPWQAQTQRLGRILSERTETLTPLGAVPYQNLFWLPSTYIEQAFEPWLPIEKSLREAAPFKARAKAVGSHSRSKPVILSYVIKSLERRRSDGIRNEPNDSANIRYDTIAKLGIWDPNIAKC